MICKEGEKEGVTNGQKERKTGRVPANKWRIAVNTEVEVPEGGNGVEHVLGLGHG